MKNEIRITGLTIRQKNALMQAFAKGEINDLLNEIYFDSVFSGDRIHIVPIVEQETEDSPLHIRYLTEN